MIKTHKIPQPLISHWYPIDLPLISHWYPIDLPLIYHGFSIHWLFRMTIYKDGLTHRDPGLRQGDAGRPDHVRITGTNAWRAALWMDEIGKKTLTNQTLLARHQPTSYESYVLNFPHHYVESTVISYIQQLIARYYIVYYITQITRLLERYRETVSPQPETLSDWCSTHDTRKFLRVPFIEIALLLSAPEFLTNWGVFQPFKPFNFRQF